MEKRLITEIERIGEIMGVKKSLITEAPLPKWMRDLIKNNFWEREGNDVVSRWAKPGEFGTIDRQGFRNISLENGENLRISRADNDALDDFLSPPRPGVATKTYETLTNNQKQLFWKILDDAMAQEGKGAEDLYNEWVKSRINFLKRYSELDVLRDVAARNKNRSDNQKLSTVEYLISEKGVDPNLARRIAPIMDEQVQLLEKGALTVNKDLKAVLKMDEELQDFLTSFNSLSPENVTRIARDRKIVVDAVEKADALYIQAKKLMKNLQDASPNNRLEIERALAETMRELYNSKELVGRQMTKFLDDMESSGDDELVELAKKIKDVRKRYTEGDDWKLLKLTKDQTRFWGKVGKAFGEGVNSKNLFTLERAAAKALGMVIKPIAAGVRWLIRLFTKKEAKEVAKTTADTIKKEFPSYMQVFRRLMTGSERGLPQDIPLVGTKSGTIDVGGTRYMDPYQELRGYGDVTIGPTIKGKRYGFTLSVPTLSYLMEIFAVSLKWVVYDMIIGTVFPAIAFHFYGGKGNYSCYNTLVKFFEEKGVTKYGVIMEYLTDEDLRKTMPKCTDQVLKDQSNMGIPFTNINLTNTPEMVAMRLDYMLTPNGSRTEEAGDLSTFWSEVWENLGSGWFTAKGLITLSPVKIDDAFWYGNKIMKKFAEWDAGASIDPELPNITDPSEMLFRDFCSDMKHTFVSFENGVGTSKDATGEIRCWQLNTNTMQEFIGIDCPGSTPKTTTTDSIPKADTTSKTVQGVNAPQTPSEKTTVEPLDSNKLKDIQQQLKQKYGN